LDITSTIFFLIELCNPEAEWKASLYLHPVSGYLNTANVLIFTKEDLALFLKEVKSKKIAKTISFYHSDFTYVKNPELFSFRMKPEEKEEYLKLLSTELIFSGVQTLKQIEIYQYKLE
jgi:hypothetical protein